jgi:NAD-dependent dihydropyrimidine dehydrogenase PreA subunit
MAKVKIEEKGCRGCTLCEDICPVDVFEYDQGKDLAKVARMDDCIGCLSCIYVCPSRCVFVTDVDVLRPFHRIEHNVALVEKFLQAKLTAASLKNEDWDEAHKDVSVRLHALAGSVTETMGRGQKAVGRKAGELAASHLPEMYEEKGVEDVLKRMQMRFKGAFDFDISTDGDKLSLMFHPCGLYQVVEDLGEKAGEATLCQLFHEYWAGLVSSFTGRKYKCEVPQAGFTCLMNLTPQVKGG